MTNATPPVQESTPDRLVRRGLKLSHLRLLAALARTGQISAAAAQLAISQPAASRLLSDVERIAGASFYRRQARGIELTAAGEHFSRLAQRMLGDLDAVSREIEEFDAGRRGFVSIGAVTGAAVEYLLPVLRQLRVTHPRINANVVVDTSDKLAPLMLADELDFYVGRIPGDIERSAFLAELVGPEPVAFIVRESHPLTRSAEPGLARCVEYDWVMQPLGGLMRQTVEAYLMDRKITLPARIISTSSTLMTLALVCQSNAIAPPLARVRVLLWRPGWSWRPHRHIAGCPGPRGLALFAPAPRAPAPFTRIANCARADPRAD
jgi:DNA-binding transcriptional LysR family regulator